MVRASQPCLERANPVQGEAEEVRRGVQGAPNVDREAVPACGGSGVADLLFALLDQEWEAVVADWGARDHWDARARDHWAAQGDLGQPAPVVGHGGVGAVAALCCWLSFARG